MKQYLKDMETREERLGVPPGSLTKYYGNSEARTVKRPSLITRTTEPLTQPTVRIEQTLEERMTVRIRRNGEETEKERVQRQTTCYEVPIHYLPYADEKKLLQG